MSEDAPNPHAPPAADLGREAAPQSPVRFAFDAIWDSTVLRVLVLFALPINWLWILALQRTDPTNWPAFLAINLVPALCARPLYDGIALVAASALATGGRASTRDLLVESLKAWPRLFTAHLLATAILLFGFLALVIPSLILAVRCSLMPAAVFFARSSAPAACIRSFDLTNERFWPIARLLLAFGLPVFAANVVASNAQEFIPLNLRTPTLTVVGVAGEIIASIGAAALAFVYLDSASKKASVPPRMPEPLAN